jgi:hypothetical protein
VRHPRKKGDNSAQGHSIGPEDPWREGLIHDLDLNTYLVTYLLRIWPLRLVSLFLRNACHAYVLIAFKTKLRQILVHLSFSISYVFAPVVLYDSRQF